jgi:hypothetical protein
LIFLPAQQAPRSEPLGRGDRQPVGQDHFITIPSTSSTEESGLFDYLLPAFAKEINIQVREVAVGTGQALKIGERGDCQSLGPENAGLPSGKN